MMRSVFVALVVGLMLAVPAVRADDETYVKIEIKGRFESARDDGPGGSNYSKITIGNNEYELDLESLPAGAPTKKDLKAMDSKLVVVEGDLVLEPKVRPRITVKRITLVKK